MGARDLLHDLAGAGLSVTADGGRLVIRPASKLTDDLRATLRAAKPELLALLTEAPARTCAACAHHLPRGTCARPIEAGLIPAAEGFGIAWPEPGHAATCPAFSDPCEPQTDAEIARFRDRRDRLTRWGWPVTVAEALARRLMRRDREHAAGDTDERVTCAGDCAHYRPGRCGNHRRAGLHSPGLGRELAGLLQHCPGFEPTTSADEGPATVERGG